MNKPIRKYIAILILCMMVLCPGTWASAENQSTKAETVSAAVIEIEKFGHAVLDITTADFINNGYAPGDIVRMRFGSYESEMPFFDGYYSPAGTTMLRGMSPEKNIAICINYGDFSKETGIAPGDNVEISMAEKSGMLAVQELNALKYSDDRTDYSDDAVFANFRAITVGRIGKGKLYRTASPIDNQRGRARYANDLIAEAGIAAILNLANSEEDIETFCRTENFDSEYYRSLYEAGNVIALDLNANFFSDEFSAALVEGLGFLAQNDPPYAIHCTEGKDRTGFAAMLLEALMGADLQEIIGDYMLSFYNYYGVDNEKEPERYHAILDTNLLVMLRHVTGADTVEALAQTDLEAAVTNYLLSNGMSENDIFALKEKLG